MEESEDYYQLLGIQSDFSEQEIREAYRRQAKLWHPDTGTGDKERFVRINDAYETLTDPERRKAYDEELLANGIGWVLDPYLVPQKIVWDENTPGKLEAKTVVLRNKTGISGVTDVDVPSKSSGIFWQISDTTTIYDPSDLASEDIVEYLIEPLSLGTISTERKTDEIVFFVNGCSVKLKLELICKRKAPVTPREPPKARPNTAPKYTPPTSTSSKTASTSSPPPTTPSAPRKHVVRTVEVDPPPWTGYYSDTKREPSTGKVIGHSLCHLVVLLLSTCFWTTGWDQWDNPLIYVCWVCHAGYAYFYFNKLEG